MKIKKLLCALFAAAMLCSMFSACGDENTDDVILPIYDAAKPNYVTDKAYIGTISEVQREVGRITTPYSVSVAFSKTDGLLDAVYVKAEQTVEKGDIIAVLRDADLEDEIAEQELKLNSTKNTYDTLIANNGDAYEIEYARIDYEIEKVKYDSLISQRNDLTLYAPISGRVNWVSDYKTGDYIGIGSTVCTINDTSKNCIVCSTEFIGSKEFGTAVTIKQGENIIEGGMVIDTITQRWGQSQLIISLPDDAEILDFGDFECIFTISKHDDAVIVPDTAVKTAGERKYVNVLLNGMKVEIDVETGIESGGETEIVSGLAGNEELILN